MLLKNKNIWKFVYIRKNTLEADLKEYNKKFGSVDYGKYDEIELQNIIQSLQDKLIIDSYVGPYGNSINLLITSRAELGKITPKTPHLTFDNIESNPENYTFAKYLYDKYFANNGRNIYEIRSQEGFLTHIINQYGKEYQRHKFYITLETRGSRNEKYFIFHDKKEQLFTVPSISSFGDEIRAMIQKQCYDNNKIDTVYIKTLDNKTEDSTAIKIINTCDLLVLMEQFNDYSSNHRDVSLPYETYRKIRKQCGITTVCDNTKTIHIYGRDNDELLYSSSINEEGFGKYIYEIYYSKRGVDNNTMSSGTCDNTTGYSGLNNITGQATGLVCDHAWSKSISNSLFDDEWKQQLDDMNMDISNLNETAINYNTNRKENDKMKGFKFDFGSCENDNVRMSMYGIAVKNSEGEWVAYNKSANEIINVELFNFDMGKYLYKMPVALSDIEVGDVIVHNRVPMFVVAVGNTEGAITAVDVRAGERKEVLLQKNMFNMNYATKVVSLFGSLDMAPTPDAPFGNMLPFMMIGEGDNVDPMMLAMMMQGGSNGNLFNNPMMMYYFMKDGQNTDMLPFMLMMQNKG